jgi:hypothetical protein
MRTVFLAASIVAGGCSIHPLPDYVGADKTLFIAKRIRCEAREAVKARFVNKAKASSLGKTREVGEKLLAETLRFDKINPADLDADTRAFFSHYDGAGIAYEFQFDMTERNGAGFDLDLLRTVSGGSLALNVGARGDLTRQNQRQFLLTDSFSGLMTTVSKADCEKFETGENWIYPIKGAIGLDEMVTTFVALDATGSLAKSDGRAAPTLLDALEFTTQIAIVAKPSLILAAAGRRWQTTALDSGENGIGAGRTDKNKVTVALSVELPPAPESPAVAKPKRLSGTVRFAPATASGARVQTRSELNATSAIQNKNYLQSIDNGRSISERLGLPSF